MSIKGLLFLLFLYILLTWLVVFYVFNPAGVEEIVRNGVFWSAIGVAALMVWLIAERIFGWWRSRAARPAKPAERRVSAAAPVHEDDAAFARLIAEADSSLAQAPGIGNRGVRDFPIHLLIGAEGSGKTSLIEKGGFDARLLAGQVAGGGGGPVASTRVANIWLANESVFVEIGARILQSEPARFAGFLRVLGPPPEPRRWRRWLLSLEGGRRMPVLKAVIVCKDLRAFVGAKDMAQPRAPQPSPDGQNIRDRLFAIAGVFGVRCPVYTIFTKADAIPYFDEFFSRLPERDEDQVWGALSKPETIAGPAAGEGVWADVETKRLNRDFGALFNRLNDRRLAALSIELVAERKPAIYEFPREFKRLRGAIVQFLVEATRPDPVALSPLRRGFFFTGVRRAERAPGGREDATSRTDSSRIGSADPTVMFRPDATQFLKNPVLGKGDLVEHWMFTSDIFLNVLKNDRPMVQSQAMAAPARGRQPRALVWGAVAAAALMTLIWLVSWNENRELIDDVMQKTEPVAHAGLDVAGLRALDDLRGILQGSLDRSGSFRMHWGLYTGDRLRADARARYFDRLRSLLLVPANERLAGHLDQVETVRPGYSSAYGWLKTHLTITNAACPVDTRTVKTTLIRTIDEFHPEFDDTRKELVARQIDYYVSDLVKPLPVSLPTDDEGIRQAREYLQHERGPQQVYENLMSELTNGAKPVSLHDSIGDYESVLAAPSEIEFGFTLKGRDKFEQIAGREKPPAGEECVLGSMENAQGKVADPDQIRGAKAIYYQNYADAWKAFLKGVRVKPFDRPEAATALDKLADSNSPLLRVIQFVSQDTYFTAPKPGESGFGGKVDQFLGGMKQKIDAAKEKAADLSKPQFGPAEVTRIFQPAQWAVQPDSPTVVTDKNKPYVEGLRHLQEGFDKYNKSPAAGQEALVPPLQDAVGAAKAAQRALADGFSNNADGVDTQIGDLLKQPIEFAERVAPKARDYPGEINASLKTLCSQVSPVLNQYPFNQNGKDASLAEFQKAFAPKTGTIWAFQQSSLADTVVKGPDGWMPKPDAKTKPAPDLLRFLNSSQRISDALFPGGQLGIQYSLRPVQSPGRSIKLTIDGTTLDSTSPFEKTFSWPGAPGHEGAEGQIFYTGGSSGFADYPGPWGAFHLFQHAEPRELKGKTVAWARTQSPGGQPQPITPPVKVEATDFPGGMDVLNPAFYAPPLACPGRAVEPQ